MCGPNDKIHQVPVEGLPKLGGAPATEKEVTNLAVMRFVCSRAGKSLSTRAPWIPKWSGRPAMPQGAPRGGGGGSSTPLWPLKAGSGAPDGALKVKTLTALVAPGHCCSWIHEITESSPSSPVQFSAHSCYIAPFRWPRLGSVNWRVEVSYDSMANPVILSHLYPIGSTMLQPISPVLALLMFASNAKAPGPLKLAQRGENVVKKCHKWRMKSIIIQEICFHSHKLNHSSREHVHMSFLVVGRH